MKFSKDIWHVKKPVVVTKVEDILLYLRDQENAVLVESDKPESVASGICYLMITLKKRERLEKRLYLGKD